MPKTLLLADDSVVIQKLVGLSFANEDVELVTTDNGDDALNRARELKPDIVLADVVMPGKNGYEVCQSIKSDPQLSTTPVLLLTGTFEAFDEDRARQVGSDGHITKPFEAQGLVDRVTDLLSRPRPAPAPVAAPAPPAAKPATAASPSAATDDAYDFFDDDVQELAAPEPAAPAPSVSSDTDSAFEFGSDLDALDDGSGDSDALDTNFDLDDDGPGSDLTASARPSAPARPAAPVDAHAPDATRVDMGETLVTEGLDAPPRAPVASLDGQLPQPPPAARPAAPAPPRPEDPAPPMLADDLFDDPTPTPTATPTPMPTPAAAPPPAPPPIPQAPPAPPAARQPAAEMPPAMDSGFEFGFEEPAATPTPPPPAAPPPPVRPIGSDPGEDLTAPRPQPAAPADLLEAPLEAEFASDDADPLAGMDAAASLAMPEASGDEPAVADAAESTYSGYDVSASDLGDPLGVSGVGAPTATPARELSPMQQGRIHETLEKIAWEAFADLSDTIVKQVIQRVESVVWEIVPQMAEALIQEEIRRMKGDD